MSMRIIVVFSCLFICGIEGLSCFAGCKLVKCTPKDKVQSTCLGLRLIRQSLTCGCCWVCPKTEGQSCGGVWDRGGTCLSKLKCINGTCQLKCPGPCSNVTCPPNKEVGADCPGEYLVFPISRCKSCCKVCPKKRGDKCDDDSGCYRRRHRGQRKLRCEKGVCV